MASASRSHDQPRSTRRSSRPLNDEEIVRKLFPDCDESDIDDSDMDHDYTQPTDVDTTDDESEHPGSTVVRPTVSPMPPRPHSTPISARPHSASATVYDIDVLMDVSDEGESFSGFSDIEPETSVVAPSTSGGSGVAGREIVASAASGQAMRDRMTQNEDAEQRPSTSRGFTPPSMAARTLPRPASAPGPRRPRRGAGGGSRRTPGVFVWSDGTDFVPQIPAFDNSDAGITDLFPDKGPDMCEMDYFTAYFDETLMEYIVQETNKYAADLIGEEELSEYSRLQRWKDTTVGEMYVFLALCMLMKHCVKHVLDHYWSKDHTVPTPMFGKYMSRDRFEILLRCLHFANEEHRNDNDRLWKVRHVLNELVGKYRDYYVPAQKLVIDESLVLFKGRLAFKQYIPSKRHRFGLKFFVLCDCETGMVLHMIMYTGTNVDIPANDQHGFSGSVVKSLLAPYLNKGHILYTDNYYTSPLLTKFLLDNRTGVCGTVKAKRREMPVLRGAMQVGDCELRKTGGILSVRWKDRREVNMLTTIHTGTMLDSGKVNRTTREIIYKPDCVLDYNINMRLVDKCDMMVGAVECVRKTVKWTKKMFFHLVDVTMLNSYNMYLVKTGGKPNYRAFSFTVVTQLLQKFGKVIPGVQRPILNPVLHHAPAPRLAYRDAFIAHRLTFLPPTGKRAVGQRACIVCMTTTKRDPKRKLVLTWCEACQVPLCHVRCYNEYHSLDEF